MPKTRGVDEVGRGPWAGPMVVGAVALGDAEIDGLADSKKLTPARREKLAREIKDKAAAVATGWVSSVEIDKLGLSAALKLAAQRAVAKIKCDYDKIIIDGTVRLIDDPRVSTLPKADALVTCVSAASIVAKVARDMYMVKLGQKYPGYGFEKHMGYGTAAHRAAIAKLGLIPEHRRSFAPIKNTTRTVLVVKKERITGTVGRLAEDVAAEYLAERGHMIVDRNWKTKICEIDIVSQKDDEIYFTEVKYRKSNREGSGLEAIDRSKERQMRLAAEVYLEFNEQFKQFQPILSAIALSGSPPVVETYIPNID
jgi:ribonuclease HII